MPLSRFNTLAKVQGVTLCSVQKGPGVDQLTDGSAAEMWLYDLGGLTETSFADTAAVLKALDLVVTVDSVAHVGGALGVPI